MGEYLAIHGDKSVIVKESMVAESNKLKLVGFLNRKGISLGSGHELVKLIPTDDGYILDLLPYYGHPGQSVQLVRKNFE